MDQGSWRLCWALVARCRVCVQDYRLLQGSSIGPEDCSWDEKLVVNTDTVDVERGLVGDICT